MKETSMNGKADRDGLGRSRLPRYALGLILLLAVLVGVVVFVGRPYTRLERLAGAMLTAYAPPGTEVGDITVSFPTKIFIEDLTVPLIINGRHDEITMEKVAGSASLLSLLTGTVKARLNGDLLGGTLWLRVHANSLLKGGGDDPPKIRIEAKVRQVDLHEFFGLLGAPFLPAGRCDADIEAGMKGQEPNSLTGEALALGHGLDIPPVDVGDVVLPRNRNVELVAKFSAREGSVFIEDFRLNGGSYRLAGTGTVTISNPIDLSPIDSSFSMVFKESPMIKDERLAQGGTSQILDSLVESQSEVFFNLVGTVRDPDLRFDLLSSLSSASEQLDR